jgi:hypothetical protein
MAATLAWACADNGEEAPEVNPVKFAPPASSCATPELPPPVGIERVVGDGTQASCTEAALRAALAEGGDITFNCGNETVTIPISEEIPVPKDASIDGNNQIVLDAESRTRILHTAARVTLTVRRLSFIRGRAAPTQDVPGSGGAIRVGWLGKLNVFECAFTGNSADDEGIEGGGAIYQSNGGALVVVESTFSQNTAISGGAIDNLLSPLTIVGSTFVDNESSGGGGAVYDDGASEKTDDAVGGDIDICGCRFEGNRSIGTGGAVYLYAYPGDRFLINQCTFVENSVTRPSDGSALGGALRTGNAPLQLANSTFSRNRADVHGGAFWTDGKEPVTITNCTFLENEAGSPEDTAAGYGGAISGFNISLKHVTMVGNTAMFSGGAISNEGDAWSMTNSIVSGNSARNPWNQGQNCTATMPGKTNLQWPAPGEGDSLCTDDVLLADPLLEALTDNGGSTETMALTPESPAIDVARDCAETDQRGQPRAQPCDMGAFEMD